MEKISVPSMGISASVSIGSQFLDIGEDGYVGRLTLGMRAEIYVWIGQGHDDLYGVDVDGRKNMVLRRILPAPQGGKCYRSRVEVKTGLNGAHHTQYPANNIRVLRLAPDGTLEVWLASLFSQNGEFFLTIQRTEKAWCHRSGETGVQCPGSRYGERAQNLAFFAQLLGEGVRDLPAEGESWPKTERPVTLRGGNDGVTQWFTDAEGTGAIQTLKGLARVHWSQITPRDRLAYLREGEKVTFKALRLPEKTSSRETALKLEAVGVTVV